MPQPLRHVLGTLLLTGTLFMGGCSATSQLAPAVTASTGRATLVLNPELSSLGRMRTQAVVPRLTADDVDHVRVQLMQVAGDSWQAVRDENGPLAIWVKRSDLNRPIVLSQLHPQTHYQVFAWAYKAPDEINDNLISVDSPLDVMVGDDDRPTVAPLRIQLKDVVFNGKATLPSFDIRPGGYAPDGVESVTMTPMEWQKVDSLALTLSGFEGDRMSQRAAEPDGEPDAHLRLSLDLPQGANIRAISLYAVDAEGAYVPGQYWTTWNYDDPQDRLLGVAQGEQLLNTGFVMRLGDFGGPTLFDLYAHSSGDFLPGKTYEVDVILSNGSGYWNTYTFPAQQEVTP
ncbi:MAG TPA: hypothetical protein V6D05_16020 [Stenomitos sp.]